MAEYKLTPDTQSVLFNLEDCVKVIFNGLSIWPSEKKFNIRADGGGTITFRAVQDYTQPITLEVPLYYSGAPDPSSEKATLTGTLTVMRTEKDSYLTNNVIVTINNISCASYINKDYYTVKLSVDDIEGSPSRQSYTSQYCLADTTRIYWPLQLKPDGKILTGVIKIEEHKHTTAYYLNSFPPSGGSASVSYVKGSSAEVEIKLYEDYFPKANAKYVLLKGRLDVNDEPTSGASNVVSLKIYSIAVYNFNDVLNEDYYSTITVDESDTYTVYNYTQREIQKSATPPVLDFPLLINNKYGHIRNTIRARCSITELGDKGLFIIKGHSQTYPTEYCPLNLPFHIGDAGSYEGIQIGRLSYDDYVKMNCNVTIFNNEDVADHSRNVRVNITSLHFSNGTTLSEFKNPKAIFTDYEGHSYEVTNDIIAAAGGTYTMYFSSYKNPDSENPVNVVTVGVSAEENDYISVFDESNNETKIYAGQGTTTVQTRPSTSWNWTTYNIALSKNRKWVSMVMNSMPMYWGNLAEIHAKSGKDVTTFIYAVKERGNGHDVYYHELPTLATNSYNVDTALQLISKDGDLYDRMPSDPYVVGCTLDSTGFDS